ncbi:MAG: hypothetical protein ACJ74O_20825 [Frankiaceae bacterium]
MDVPSEQDREALLELLLAMGGPLMWTGPIPYDALGARRASTGGAAPDAGAVVTAPHEPVPPNRHAA